MHPLHIVFPQHVWYILPVYSDGRSRKQIGQSPNSDGGGLNSFSSCNFAARSAARLQCSSHCSLCLCRCFFLHAALQYFVILHLLHVFILSLPSLPQLSHINTPFLSAVLIFCSISLTSHTSFRIIDVPLILLCLCLMTITYIK